MTRHRLIALAANLAGALMPLTSSAGTAVYRCGQTYQQAPCAASPGQIVEVGDPRAADQQRDRDNATAADQKLARELAAQRREREKGLHPQTRAAGIPVAAAAPPASSPDPSARCKSGAKSKTQRGRRIRCVGNTPLYVAPASPAGH